MGSPNTYGCYEAATKELSSGQNDNDLIKSAHQIFYNDYGFKFGLEHAWRELRHDQKSCSASAEKDGGKVKRRKVEDGIKGVSSSQPESNGAVSMSRVPGVKTSKAAKGKWNGSTTNAESSEGKGLAELESMWKIKKIDLERKDKICRKSLRLSF
ncbi:glutathione S-transferase T2-like [Eutrema salsugineum]|uniref:glutathione S-transferase T2-like n=1 Tax=Eutrema salsugineum TaxID=72664 RepID=UPI000CED33F6|nr:glutathione S-transferase T2-like [Eutrema salsugineum]